MAKAKKQKTPKKAKETTTKPKAENKSPPKIFNNDDPEAKALFLQHMPKIKDLKAKVATATANLRNAYKSAKAQGGFEKTDFDYAFQLETAEAEAKTRAKIARNLTIARYMGSDLGAQLDLFLEPVRTPAADRAYHEGETASMQNKPAQPSYAPETEQYRQYMAGFHNHQESLTKGKNGIKPLHPEVAKDVKQTAAQKKKAEKQKAEDASAFDAKAPSSGTPITRSEFEKMAAGGVPAESHFQKN